jgi:hypothetical protein
MSRLVVKNEIIRKLLEPEIKKLFSEQAHAQFDFENFEFTNDDGDGNNELVFPDVEIREIYRADK